MVGPYFFQWIEGTESPTRSSVNISIFGRLECPLAVLIGRQILINQFLFGMAYLVVLKEIPRLG